MKLNIIKDKQQADPYIFKYKDLYYIFVTGTDGVEFYSSINKLDWYYKGICFKIDGFKEYWAPCLIEIDNTFYLYLSCVKKDETDDNMQSIIVASSKCVEGPYKKEVDLLPPFSIDPHVVKSGSDYFIFYSTNSLKEERVGTLVVVDKLISPIKVEGKPKIVVKPTLDEEIFERNRYKNNQDWYTIEGPFYFEKDGYHYLLYSGNCYLNPAYFVGFAVCKSNETDLRKLNFVKYPDNNTFYPLLKSDNSEISTGHCSILEEDNTYYIYYHGRDNEKSIRTARMAKLRVDNGILNISKL